MTMGDGRKAWQFDLYGILELTFAVGVGLTAWRVAHTWNAFFEGAIGAAFLLGLAYQIRDLWGCRAIPNLPPAIRQGLWFSISWRVVAGPLLLTLIFLKYAPFAAPADETVAERLSRAWPQLSEGTVLLLITIVLLASRLAYWRAPVPSADRRWRDGLVWSGVAVATLLVGLSMLMVYAFAHVAFDGIVQALPYARSGVVFQPAIDQNAEVARFIHWSLGAGLLVPLNVWLTLRLARGGGRLAGCVQVAVLLVTLAITAAYVLWVERVQFPRTSPFLAQAMPPLPLRLWFFAAVLVGTVAWAGSGRAVQRGTGITHRWPGTWRARARRYYHESLPVLAMLLLLISARILREALADTWPTTPVWRLFQIGYSVVGEPIGLLRLAVLVAILTLILRRWRAGGEAGEMEWSGFSWGRFCLVWPAMIATTVTSAPVLAGFCFALWLALGRT